MTGMLVEELLVGELGYDCGVAARFVRVGGVGEQRRGKRVVEHRIGIGKGALHLVVHDAVVAQRLVGPVDLVVPSLLLEDGALLVDRGVENGIHIDVHEVQKVLLVGARHRVHRFIRERHGVQKRLHGAFDEVDEGLFDGEFVRAAQHRVLEDVKDPRTVCGGSFERDRERFVFVVVLQKEKPGPACRVAQRIGAAVDFFQVFSGFDSESVQGHADFEIQGKPPFCVWRGVRKMLAASTFPRRCKHPATVRIRFVYRRL